MVTKSGKEETRGRKTVKKQTPRVKFHNTIKNNYYNLSTGRITRNEYDKKQLEAKIERNAGMLEELKEKLNNKPEHKE